ncbi:hypothetical protein EJ08DRAFT_716244 [Tothia fuscella]|uniref:Uncharacterized protein n=1 Tax=Tothia fuscella TaxID=1048955 RepID=A0A9P4TYL9_9PEZI|nr:hypothetical protein EJ08DRAFT_716244 [Tothia fuscella]
MAERQDPVNVEAREVDYTRAGTPNGEAPPAEKGIISTLREEEWWKWELTGIFDSALCLKGIVIILSRLDDRPQLARARPKDYCVKVLYINKTKCQCGSISVNSLISWLSTVSKIWVFIPVTKGLGQLKWVWFAEKERKLTDLETFDSATRGLTGSALLVWKLRGWHVGYLQLLAVILGLGFKPFIQNLIRYYPKTVVDSLQPAYVANASQCNTVGHLLGASSKGYPR